MPLGPPRAPLKNAKRAMSSLTRKKPSKSDLGGSKWSKKLIFSTFLACFYKSRIYTAVVPALKYVSMSALVKWRF